MQAAPYHGISACHCAYGLKLAWLEYICILKTDITSIVPEGSCHTVYLCLRPEALCFWVVRPSLRPFIRPKPEIPSFHLYMGPLVHPTNRDRFTACQSVRLSVRPCVRLSVRRGFRAFAGEHMEVMAWNVACWCIVATFRTDQIMVIVWWFF